MTRDKTKKKPQTYKLLPDGGILVTNPNRKNCWTAIDANDLIWVKDRLIQCDQNGYASISINGKKIQLHRLIMKAPEELDVDHGDGDTRNNRKSNLKLATKSQNARNRHKRKETSCTYLGVTRIGSNFQAQASVDGRTKYLGFRNNARAAAILYDDFIYLIEPEFCCLNCPQIHLVKTKLKEAIANGI